MGHQAADHCTRNVLTEMNPWPIYKLKFKKKNASQAYVLIWNIVLDLPEEEREACMVMMKDQGF
jgi:hypothetical protein